MDQHLYSTVARRESQKEARESNKKPVSYKTSVKPPRVPLLPSLQQQIDYQSQISNGGQGHVREVIEIRAKIKLVASIADLGLAFAKSFTYLLLTHHTQHFYSDE